MEVVCSCGKKLGEVDRLEHHAIRLTGSSSPDGKPHRIPLQWVDDVNSPWALTWRFQEVFRFLQKNLEQEGDIKLREIEYAAVNGMLRTLDPHSILLTPDEYSRQLFRLGFESPRACLMVYPHVLADRGSVVEWVKGTLLAEYEKRLPEALFARFVEEYRARLLPRFEDTRPFFYPFKRVLCWGQRA
jgi:hypothetical protein